ncbi:proto-oncogene tyrosine-protein kinase ROS-like, partial [Contarinia nasturtii]|uniref:proto-oncogene tyrosine-protein kinase ROS-like n=1 Tax=Contarinia nasturtii TaxID=265458 RepID=UPI0012D44EB5
GGKFVAQGGVFCTLDPLVRIYACNISNLEWFEDILYYVCGNTLYSFNRTTNNTQKLDVKGSVQAIAVDWIGRHLYWFNPLHQVLTRDNLINFKPEILFPLTAVEVDIKIDAIRGYLYFSTGNSVEYCRLNCNDKNRKKFYSIESFTGRKVMGLTLDFDINRVYWIICGYESATLAIAPLIYDEFSAVVIEEFTLTENKILGPLAYLSNRLMWLQDDHTAVIGNLTGKNLAHIQNIELSDLRSFLVIDKTQRSILDSDVPLNVIPEAVNASTIQVIGKWNFFKIIWQPIETVNYGEVFYEIRYLNQTVVEKSPFVEMKGDKIPAYSQLNVTIKAFTYWASSVAVEKIVYSPSAPPSEPLEPRIFVKHIHNLLKDDLDIEVVFRWNKPKATNGPLIGYKIRCWYEKDNIRHEKYNDYEMQPEKNEEYIETVEKNTTFYCKVRAETLAGVGNYSSLISINTQNEKPIPQLFAASNDKIYVVDFDLKLHKSIVNAGSKVEHLCYIALNKEFFWTNENNELMAFSRDGRKKLYSMNKPVLSLTVDWIERIVYWSQSESKGSSINSFNLNTQKSNRILKSPHFIINLNVAPLNRQLFWIDSESHISTRGKLVSLHLDDEQSLAFLDSKNESIFVTQQTLFLDTFTVDHEKVVWLSDINQLISTDIRTRASTVVNFTYQPNMMNFNRDSARIYWTQNNITFAENQLEQAPYKHTFFYPMKILPIFRQNYPPIRCLLPPKDFYSKEKLVVNKSTDRTLWLNLPVPKGVDSCSFVPMFWKFRIMYAELEIEESQICSVNTCNSPETSDKLIEINNLKPFTKYQFQIGISNFYTEYLHMSLNFTRPLVFQTEIGAPSSPRNVTTKMLSPTEIYLSWLPPLEINGPEIQYEVHYSTENEINGKKNHVKMTVKGENVTSITINELLPNQPYIVWVQAHTTEMLYSESPHIKIKTLPNPEMIQLISSTSKSLTVAWEPYVHASKYMMFCRPIECNDSFADLILDSAHEVNSTNIQRSGHKVTLLKLHPKSQYIFWLQFWFKNRIDPYTWPQKERFVFKTYTDRPIAPGKPSIMIRNNKYEIIWAPAESNDSKIEEYCLEGLRMRGLNQAGHSTNSIEKISQGNTLMELRQTFNESEPIADSWVVYYKGNDTFWKVEGLNDIAMYSFRVKAQNANGWGEYSALSGRITDIQPLSTNSEQLVIAVAAPALIAILIVTVWCFTWRRKRLYNLQGESSGYRSYAMLSLTACQHYMGQQNNQNHHH